MSDFLARLAGRALGVVPVAEPIIRSPYVPPSISEANGVAAHAGDADVTVSAMRAGSDDKLSRVALSTARQATFPAARGNSPPAIKPVEIGHQAGPDVTETGPDRDASLRPLPISREAQLALGENKFAPETKQRRPSGMQTAPVLPAVHRTMPNPINSANVCVTLPAPPRSNDAPSRRSPSAVVHPSAPIVRVTIGRVDVHAEFSPTPTRDVSRRGPPQVPALSLDEYLRQRREGRR